MKNAHDYPFNDPSTFGDEHRTAKFDTLIGSAINIIPVSTNPFEIYQMHAPRKKKRAKLIDS